MQDVADSRKKENDNLEKMAALEGRSEKLKDDLRTAHRQIASLAEDNKRLQQTIERLKAEVVEKQKKPAVSCAGTNPRKRKVENGGTSPEGPDNRDEGVQFESEDNPEKKISELQEQLALVNSNVKLVMDGGGASVGGFNGVLV